MNNSETINKILKNLIFPFVSILVIIALYFVFINPYFNYQRNFESIKSGYENSNEILKTNLALLEKVNSSAEKLAKLDIALQSLVPDTANPSDLVGLIDKTSSEFRFGSVDENRNITSIENDRNQVIQVSFNGKSPGIVSSVGFIKSLATSKTKLIKITKLQLTNNPEELHTRVSFNAFSIYANPVPLSTPETPIVDYFEDPKFIELLNSF